MVKLQMLLKDVRSPVVLCPKYSCTCPLPVVSADGYVGTAGKVKPTLSPFYNEEESNCHVSFGIGCGLRFPLVLDFGFCIRR